VGRLKKKPKKPCRFGYKTLGKVHFGGEPHVWSETHNAEIANLGARSSQNILAEM